MGINSTFKRETDREKGELGFEIWKGKEMENEEGEERRWWEMAWNRKGGKGNEGTCRCLSHSSNGKCEGQATDFKKAPRIRLLRVRGKILMGPINSRHPKKKYYYYFLCYLEIQNLY